MIRMWQYFDNVCKFTLDSMCIVSVTRREYWEAIHNYVKL